MESAFRDPGLKLIETFGWDGTAYVRLARHLLRMGASAAALGISFDAARVAAALPAAPDHAPRRMRLTLDRDGRPEVTHGPLAPTPSEWRLAVAAEPLRSNDPRLRHKTTDRALYDRVRAALPSGADEVIFLNERGHVAEGTITNIFFDLGEGMRTPPLSDGCLPGCLRAELIAGGRVREAQLALSALPRARLWVGNSLRGLIPARLHA